MGDSLFSVISDSDLAAWVVRSPYIWPTLESIHFVSLCALFGCIMVVDLRLIGLLREPLKAASQTLIRIALAAFGINLATGVLFFFGNTFKYVDNPAFELKLVLILIAGLNALYVRTRLSHVIATNSATRASAAAGYLSLLVWAGVIVCGRMITFYAR